MTWPTGLDRTTGLDRNPAPTTSCRVRPLPHTIRPCDTDRVGGERVERTVFPVHHVAACCVIGTAIWAAVITLGRIAIEMLTHLA